MLQNSIAARMLAGASVAALSLGLAMGAAQTQPIGHEGDASVEPITNPAGTTIPYIYVDTSTVTGDVTNAGEITPGWSNGDAEPSDVGSDDAALAAGITIDDSLVEGGVINLATGEIASVAEADDPRAYGILISDSMVEGAVENNNLVSATADGVDSAQASGVRIRFGSEVGGVSNAAGGEISATATAADAEAGGVVVTSGSEVDGDIENAGAINASAEAESDSDADAEAHGILVRWGGEVAGDVNNDGTIDVIAAATVEATSGKATASASAGGVGTIQGGAIGGDIVNTGEITVDASALASTSASGSANADATAFGIRHATDADASFIDNSGGVTVAATADASAAPNLSGSASVRDVVGTAQAVEGIGDRTAELANSGDIGVDATAIAVGAASGYEAEVVGVYGAAQDVDAGNGAALVDNSGSITVDANAVAGGSSGASANTDDVAGIRQWVDAVTNATAEADNSSADSITVTASSTALAPEADADVIDIRGVGQLVTGGGNNTAVVTNSGAVTVAADAIAARSGNEAEGYTAAEEDAGAWVEEVTGLRQVAIGGSGDTNLTVENSGDVGVSAAAQAYGEGAYAEEEANAEVVDIRGVSQAAFGPGNGLVATTNAAGGAITVDASALAAGEGGPAAYIEDVAGIGQGVIGARVNGAAIVENAGDVGVTLEAFADGEDAAAAGIEDTYGVRQLVFAGAAATAELTNAGSVVLSAEATANVAAGGGPSDADAVIGDVYGVAQIAGAEESARAFVGNAGGSVEVSAVANATSAGGNADSFASIGAMDGGDPMANGGVTGISQQAFSAELAEARVDNAGGAVTVAANATANASDEVEDADATAEIFNVGGVVQLADSAEIASAGVNNTDGAIDVSAVATAVSGIDDADAEIGLVGGVMQQTFVEFGVAEASVDNAGGVITVTAEASAETASETEEEGATADVGVIGTFGVAQTAFGAEEATVGLDNAGGEIAVTAGASAAAASSAEDGSAEAGANIMGALGVVQIASGEAAAAGVDNTAGAISVAATAVATSDGPDEDDATSSDAGILGALGVLQVSLGDDALSVMDNSDGAVDVAAIATAESTGAAGANIMGAVGVGQVGASGINGFGPVVSQTLALPDDWPGDFEGGSAFLDNTGGAVVVNAGASADGDEEAEATVGLVGGVVQAATGEADASAIVENGAGGLVQVAADAAAQSEGGAEAAVFGVAGIGQAAVTGPFGAIETSLASVENAGTVEVGAAATALAMGEEEAGANAQIEQVYGVGQLVLANNVNEENAAGVAEVFNTGAINVNVAALAAGGPGDAPANASGEANAGIADVYGVRQMVMAEDGDATVENSGVIDVAANAAAYGDAGASVGDAGASVDIDEVYGVWQSVNGGPPNIVEPLTATIINDGRITVATTGRAAGGDGAATAYVDATGASQSDAAIVFENREGATFEVRATAEAMGSEGSIADADALGVGMEADGELAADFLNAANFSVIAEAIAEGAETEARADAIGLLVSADAIVDELDDGNGNGNGVGTFLNTGRFYVGADAPGGVATATGMEFDANAFTDTIINEGEDGHIIAYAVGGEGSTATGIVISGEGEGEDEGVIINDGGLIWAGVSEEMIEGLDFRGAYWEGEPVNRGTAIDLSDAPNPITVTLAGSEAAGHWGRIFGDILLSEDDAIIVEDGVTSFNGVVNPESDEPVGTMTIETGGALFLRLHEPDGASQVNVADFTQAGDLWLEIAPTPNGTAPAGPDGNFIPQINGGEVALGGDVMLRPTAGLYADAFAYTDVVTGDIDGEWDNVLVWTPLLTAEAETNDDENIDINVARVGFGEVNGLGQNQGAVGGGIEAVYDDLFGPGADEDFAGLVGALFTLNGEEYAEALGVLSGAIYPQTLYSVTTSLDLFRRAENARMKGAFHFFGPEGLDGVPPGSVWATLQGAWADVDGDGEAPGFDHDRMAAHIGLDYRFLPNLTTGIALGYYDAELDFDAGSQSAEYDGFQIGAYANYDLDNFYVNAMLAYGDYSGSASRGLAFARTPDDLECGCLPVDVFGDAVSGDFDADAWMASGELGYHFDIAERSRVTPFAALTYSRGNIDGFTESGGPMALSVDGSGESTVSDIGVRAVHGLDFGGSSANIDLRLSWMHEFGDNPYAVNAAFAAAPGSDFTVIGSEMSRDTIAFDAGMSWDVNERMAVGASYNGRYNSDLTDHGLMARAIYRFGEVASPVAQPVVAEPEPAPAVAQEVFLVFFDWDRSNLTAEANNTLDQVVVAHNQQQVTRIMVDGHADRSGPASYNQGLSERRAESVRQGLIARGVAPDEIVTRAFGETQPLVPTPDGVREPQNRRVEIIFS